MMDRGPEDWTVWLEAQRHRAINLILVLVLATGLMALAYSLFHAVASGKPSPNLPYYAAAYLAILGILLARPLSDQLRAQLFLIVMYGFALFSLVAGWLAGGGRVFLLASIVVGKRCPPSGRTTRFRLACIRRILCTGEASNAHHTDKQESKNHWLSSVHM